MTELATPVGAGAQAPRAFAVTGQRAIAWACTVVAGVAAVWAGSLLGWWWSPFACGLVVGFAARPLRCRRRSAIAAAALIALAGWGLPLLWRVLDGEPVGAAARTAAALAGLPPAPVLVVSATMLTAVFQSLAGAWLGWALGVDRPPVDQGESNAQADQDGSTTPGDPSEA
ncbi:hypothetical protein ACGFJC_26200 [Nonomuraea fuscirosea]|uniref:hypothetical protein n=1 Tax=Nonomuraea fuscirosea TaxID=1291556 RepID=UPI00371E7D23